MVIDTNIFIEYLRAKNKKNTTLQKISDTENIYISAITLFELYAGATNQQKVEDIELLTDGITILEFTSEIAKKSAEIFQILKKSNQIIDFRDIFIASTCIYYELPLLTKNKGDFSRIYDLKLSDI